MVRDTNKASFKTATAQPLQFIFATYCNPQYHRANIVIANDFPLATFILEDAMQDVASKESVSVEIVELEEVIAYSVETTVGGSVNGDGDVTVTVGAKTLW